MDNSAWTTVAMRLFAFSVLPVLLAALHLRSDAGAKGRLRAVEVYLIYLFTLGVAAGGFSGFFGHVFTPDTVAESIGWPKGNPFQQEMGFANLALGVLGLIAAGRRDGFREATVIAIAIVGVGCDRGSCHRHGARRQPGSGKLDPEHREPPEAGSADTAPHSESSF